mgnify:CR=1 FL=1
MKKINLAVVGATGMVGRTFLKVLEERQLPIENFYVMASARSAGKTLEFNGKEYVVEELNEHSFRVTGNNDYQGKAFTTYYDNYAAAGVVKPGETKSGTFAYEIDNPKRMPEYYKVVFKNSSGDIAEVKVDLQ